MRFIDARLFWEARINRADLMAHFAVSPAQAALDFRQYLSRASRGVHYDTRAKAYVTEPTFAPVFGVPDAATTLATLGQSGDHATWRLPELARPLDAALAARVRRAVRDGERLHVDYQSFTRADPSQRWIAPARLVSDGQRWHVRSWCFQRTAWRDFVLARIIAVHGAEPAGDLPPDAEWDETVVIVLRPARHLSRAQQAAVAREFAMTGGCVVVRLPRAMLIYARRTWGLDLPDSRLEAETSAEA